MNSQCCGLWMYCKAFGSRLLQSAYLKLPSELKEIGRNPLFLVFFWYHFFLWPATDYSFCRSHSFVVELSMGSASEELTPCIYQVQVTTKTAT